MHFSHYVFSFIWKPLEASNLQLLPHHLYEWRPDAIHPEDIHFCTADIGWITGHSYIVYGPLAEGATSLMFEGVPTYPNPGRFWDICDKHQVHQVSIFYTAPTAIRALTPNVRFTITNGFSIWITTLTWLCSTRGSSVKNWAGSMRRAHVSETSRREKKCS